MYKMILSDLDETLLVNHHVPKMNQDAIHQMKDVLFVPATGRSFPMIEDILKEIGTYQQSHQYSICFNGGLIVENKEAQILSFQGLSFEEAKLLFDWGEKYHVCVMIFTLDHCYLFRAEPSEIERKTVQKQLFQLLMNIIWIF